MYVDYRSGAGVKHPVASSPEPPTSPSSALSRYLVISIRVKNVYLSKYFYCLFGTSYDVISFITITLITYRNVFNARRKVNQIQVTAGNNLFLFDRLYLQFSREVSYNSDSYSHFEVTT